MDPDAIAPMIVIVVTVLTVGGVLILRPLSHRLAELLEAMARERREPSDRIEEELVRVREQLEGTLNRVRLLEERQDFTERLLESREVPVRELVKGEQEGSAARTDGG